MGEVFFCRTEGPMFSIEDEKHRLRLVAQIGDDQKCVDVVCDEHGHLDPGDGVSALYLLTEAFRASRR